MALEIGSVVHAAEDADWPACRFGHVTRMLECVPRHLEEVAVLWIHQLRLERRHAKEARIEHLDVVEHAAGRDVCRVVAQRGRNARVELLGREEPD